MKLAYDFNLEDWSSFQRFHYSTSPSCRRMRNMGRILLPVAVLLLITSQFLRRRFDPVYFGIFATFSIVWFILYPRWFDAKIIRRSTQFLKEGNTDSMFGRREIELLPDRVHIISPSGEATYHASAITKTVETPNALLLYVSSIQALILPRRKLSDADFQQAAVFVREHYAGESANS
jgi:hypothetical protein